MPQPKTTAPGPRPVRPHPRRDRVRPRQFGRGRGRQCAAHSRVHRPDRKEAARSAGVGADRAHLRACAAQGHLRMDRRVLEGRRAGEGRFSDHARRHRPSAERARIREGHDRCNDHSRGGCFFERGILPHRSSRPGEDAPAAGLRTRASAGGGVAEAPGSLRISASRSTVSTPPGSAASTLSPSPPRRRE